MECARSDRKTARRKSHGRQSEKNRLLSLVPCVLPLAPYDSRLAVFVALASFLPMAYFHALQPRSHYRFPENGVEKEMGLNRLEEQVSP